MIPSKIFNDRSFDVSNLIYLMIYKKISSKELNTIISMLPRYSVINIFLYSTTFDVLLDNKINVQK